MSTPEIRFKGFVDDWKISKLGKYSIINPGTGDIPSAFYYIDLESVTKGNYVRKAKILKSNAPSRAQRNLKQGDILFQTVRPYQQNNYYFELIDGEYVASTGYAQIRSRENSKFLYHQLHTEKFLESVLNKCEGGNYPAINSTNLKQIQVSYPSLLEQQKIAFFFNTVDKKLNHLKKKKELLEQYKKGVMQKIFSQELRFKDENGEEFPEWEVVKFADFGEIITGKTPSTKVKEFWDGDVLFVTPTDLKGEKFLFTTQRMVTRRNLNILPLRSIMFTCIASIGKMALSTKPSITNQQINSIIPKKNYNNELVYYALLHKVEFIKSTQSSNTLPIINKTEFSKFKVHFPTSITEQKRIAEFLSSIDNKIELVSKQIEKTELWKRGLMQKMFV